MEGKQMCLDLESLKIQENGLSLLESVSACLGSGDVMGGILEDIASTIGKKMGLRQKSGGLQTIANFLSQYAILELGQNVLGIGSGFKTLDTSGITLAQIKNIVQNIEKKVDVVLNAPLELAIRNMTSAITAVETKNFKEAYHCFDKVLNNAMEAFQYSVGQGSQIETFRKSVSAMKLLIFARIAKLSFDATKNQFMSFYLLEKPQKDLITMELEHDVKDILALQKKTKAKKLCLPSDRKKEKSEIIDLLDSILKITYPYMSEGKGLTSAWSVIPTGSKSINFTVLPNILPDGQEDKTEVILGRAFPSEGPEMTATGDNSYRFIKISMWKKERFIYISSKQSVQKFEFPSATDEFVISYDLTATTGLLLVSSTGLSAEWAGCCLGQYRLTDPYAGCDVYKQDHTVGTNCWYIYRHNNTWYISYKIGKDYGAMQNTSQSQSVPQSGWQCAVDGKWTPDDHLTILASPLALCGPVTITARGPAAATVPDCLGTYHPSDQWAAGRQVFRQEGEGGRYLRMEHGYSNWSVSSTPDGSGGDYIASGCGTLCPGDSRAAISERFNLTRWRYKDGGKHTEGEIEVVCQKHRE